MIGTMKRLVEIWLGLTGRRGATAGKGGLEVVFYGQMLDDHWRAALKAPSSVWTTIPSVSCVTHAPRGLGDFLVRTADPSTVVIPLIERDIARCPKGGRRLAPTPEACAIFADKRRFAAFVDTQGLGDVAARGFPPEAPPAFPCVLKRVDERNGRGIVRVDTPEDLARRLDEPTWRGRDVVLQEWIDGVNEFVTHLVCERGRILWHRTYVYGLKPGETIRSDARIASKAPADLAVADLADMERLLIPTRYDGPCNVNFKRRADGRIAVFEINPRFGGSLVRPEARADLAEALAVIVAKARPSEG